MAGAKASCAKIPDEVRLIAARQELEICPVCSVGALDGLLQDVQPVVLAWDMYNGVPEDWAIIQRMRYNPQLSNLPLVLFEAGGTPAVQVWRHQRIDETLP